MYTCSHVCTHIHMHIHVHRDTYTDTHTIIINKRFCRQAKIGEICH